MLQEFRRNTGERNKTVVTYELTIINFVNRDYVSDFPITRIYGKREGLREYVSERNSGNAFIVY